MGDNETQPADIHHASSGKFAESFLNLYHGPLVTVRVGSTSIEYKLSKDLICTQSPYFRKTFEGNFKESEEHSVTLDLVDGVVTTRSVELLIQWLYTGGIRSEDTTPEEEIDAIVEFLRISDMCGVTGMESLMAERTRAILVKSKTGSKPYTDFFSHTAVNSATCLPVDHPIRKVFADATLRESLKKDDYKFIEEARYTTFGCDLLSAIHRSLRTARVDKYFPVVPDPLDGENITLHR